MSDTVLASPSLQLDGFTEDRKPCFNLSMCMRGPATGPARPNPYPSGEPTHPSLSAVHNPIGSTIIRRENLCSTRSACSRRRQFIQPRLFSGVLEVLLQESSCLNPSPIVLVPPF